MAQQPSAVGIKIATAQDPDNVAEVFVNGPINCNVQGPFAQLTFTHVRAETRDLFDGKKLPKVATIVRARILLPLEQLNELRKLLDGIIGDAPAG